jgi:uncharacterized protein with HEPN domain
MRHDDDRLQDILEAIAKIERHAVWERGEFDRDEMVQTWYFHNLLIIGEAASGLSSELRRQRREVPWPKIIAMRNILAHEYFGVDIDEVWRTVQNDLPVLKRMIEAIVEQRGNDA